MLADLGACCASPSPPQRVTRSTRAATSSSQRSRGWRRRGAGAIDAQRGSQGTRPAPVRVRIGLHKVPHRSDEDGYVGRRVHRRSDRERGSRRPDRRHRRHRRSSSRPAETCVNRALGAPGAAEPNGSSARRARSRGDFPTLRAGPARRRSRRARDDRSDARGRSRGCSSDAGSTSWRSPATRRIARHVAIAPSPTWPWFDIRMPPTKPTRGSSPPSRFASVIPALGVIVLSQYVEPATRWSALRERRERSATC